MQHLELGWKRAIILFPCAFQLAHPSGISVATPLQWTLENKTVPQQCWLTILPSQQQQWYVRE
jgi:hypothetical protein